ncbi:hypothetical protein B0O80DRAFT_232329 [Mortierella sp. GBAus27b]|nr:hypothetical protein B0O80DRAFT_232329 [Mortierella sp. GBAus27b]
MYCSLKTRSLIVLWFRSSASSVCLCSTRTTKQRNSLFTRSDNNGVRIQAPTTHQNLLPSRVICLLTYITSFHWLIHALSRISHIQRMAIGCTFLPTRYREALTAEAEVSQVIRNSYLAQNLMQITRSLGSSGVLSRRSCLHTEATDM